MDTEDLPPPPHPEIDIMDGGDEEQDIVTVPLPDYEDDGDIMAPSFNSFTPGSADVEIGNKKEDDGLSDNEDEFDFTDADAAIDKMLDDLQDFQLVSIKCISKIDLLGISLKKINLVIILH